jgi:hypothetical protein
MAKRANSKTSHALARGASFWRVLQKTQIPAARPIINVVKARWEFRPLKTNARQMPLTTLAPAALMIPAAILSPLTAQLLLMG